MLRFFRKIRRNLLSGGNFRKYVLYASGEIILIVIGILIALQLDTWSSNHVQKKQFLTLLEQTYNSLFTDSELHYTNMKELREQITMIDQLLMAPDTFPDYEIPTRLYYADQYLPASIYSRARELLPFFNYEAGDVRQKEVIKQILSYCSDSPFAYSEDMPLQAVLAPLLMQEGIPRPSTIFIFSADQGYDRGAFFEEEEVQKARSLLEDQKFRSALKTLRGNKEEILNYLGNDREGGLGILSLIEDYYPGVQLLFDDIGIIGDALDSGWTKSIPLSRQKGQNCMWEVELTLKDGTVKFRNRNSWSQNWGGNDFPTGRNIYLGEDIRVKAGHYHIRLDLCESRYEFLKIE